MDRRGFLKGLSGILAAGVAPAIITTPGLLMPVRAPVKLRGIEVVYDDISAPKDYFARIVYANNEQRDLFSPRSRLLTVEEFTALSAKILDKHILESGTQDPRAYIGRWLNS